MYLVKLRVKGHIDESWSEWLSDLAITHLSNDASTLTGPIPDQAALYGLITKVRDLGLELLSVEFTERNG